MRRKRSTAPEQGQSLAELAVIVPILMIIVLGSIDLGRVFFAYISVTNAARNGVQYATTSPENAADVNGIREAALADTGELLDTSMTNPGVAVTTGSDGTGHPYAEITVSYTFSSLFPWPGLPDPINIERTVRGMIAP